MKTITYQGTEAQLKGIKPYKTIKEVETRVYAIDTFNLEDRRWNDLTDEEFIDLAEQEGNVYTISGFAEAFNNADVNSEIDVIRFISVRLF